MRVWLLGVTGSELGLAEALVRRGVSVGIYPLGSPPMLAPTFEVPALILLDAADPDGQAFLRRAEDCALPIVVRSAPDVPVTEGFAISAALDAEAQAHHLADILRDAENLRRHPRVPVRREIRLGEARAWTRDLSLDGVRVDGTIALPAGDFPAELDGGPGQPVIRLIVREVSRHGDGIALRCRPERDLDLVVWLDLLLGALAAGPLYRDADPFGPLFAAHP